MLSGSSYLCGFCVGSSINEPRCRRSAVVFRVRARVLSAGGGKYRRRKRASRDFLPVRSSPSALLVLYGSRVAACLLPPSRRRFSRCCLRFDRVSTFVQRNIPGHTGARHSGIESVKYLQNTPLPFLHTNHE